MIRTRSYRCLALLLLAALTACLPAAAHPSVPALPATTAAPSLTAATALPATATLPPTATPTPGPTFTPTLTPLPTPTPCPPEVCFYSGALFLRRPIQPPGRDSVDTSYRFGSTQAGQRDPHHGVEFLNSFGTPVLAAADGVVAFAGDDTKVLVGPYPNFYGNVIILKHSVPAEVLRQFPGLPQPFYTLYGHLSKELVKLGDTVTAGQEIGLVGMTGIATGSHLHFEVRLGGISYEFSRNPELWLQPHMDEAGKPNGALAVRVLDAQGQSIAPADIVIQRLDGPQGAALSEFYVESYAEKKLLGEAPFYDSFGAGDLPAGWYWISFAYEGLQKHVVQVFPFQVTQVTLRIQP